MRRHAVWLRMATGTFAPGRSSSAVNGRPRSSATPNVSKKLAVTMFTNTRRVDEHSVIPAKANVCPVSDAKTSDRVRRSA